MTPEELKKLEDTFAQQVVGQQHAIDEVLTALLKRAQKKGSILLTGEAGTGKSAIFEAVADRIAEQRMQDRFKDIIHMKPFGPVELGKLVEKLVDENEKVSPDRREEAKAVMRELLEQVGYDDTKGLRSLRPMVEAVAEASTHPDMREALAGKYPDYVRHLRMKSGERLAESFTRGTAGKTCALKPFRLKSRGVGFFSLN